MALGPAQPEMWIMDIAIKYPTIISAWGEAELEQLLATLLLQGGMYIQGSALTGLVEQEAQSRRHQCGFWQQLL